ncbi:MAG: YfdX family protein [Deferribacteres bacterium]|nr:YfdX family protein [Deferribacteres bacterium]
MKRHGAITLSACCLLLSLVIPGTVRSMGIEERASGIPGRVITSGEEAISSTAVRALRHIAQARADIHEKNVDHARAELKQSLALLNDIKAALPTVKVKDYIWVARKHLSYEDTKEIIPDLIPVYTSLKEIEDIVSVDRVRELIAEARRNLEKGNTEDARKALQSAEDAIVYSEIDLPLVYTEKHLIAAQRFLAGNELQKADTALKSAEDGVRFLSVDIYSPLTKAKKSLWRAGKHYAAGKLAAARKDLKQAKTSLAAAIKTGVYKTKAEAELNALLKDAENTEAGVEKSKKRLGADIRSLWERAKALSEHSAERLSTALQRLRVTSPVAADIIDAKLHVAYAETYQITAGRPDKAASEIDKALACIQRALPNADSVTEAQLTVITRYLKEIKTDLNRRDMVVKLLYENIKSELRTLIRNLY